MSATLIQNVQWVQPGEGVSPGDVLVRGGQIAETGAKLKPQSGDAVVDGKGRLLTPGLIDIHTNGLDTALYERSEQDILAAAKILPKFGTTCVLPTFYRIMNRPSLTLLEKLADTLPKAEGACMPGLHLRGPFLALHGSGAEMIPGDLCLLEELLAACHGRVLAMSISPETPNILPIIEALAAKGIAPWITHTKATAEQTQAAIDAGARHATIFYNVLPAPEVTEPGVRPVGVVEAVLANPHVSVDFICDGVHVSPFAIKAALAAKGWEGVVIVTNSNIGAGLPPGEYDTVWGFRVRTAPNDAARVSSKGHPSYGELAGSTITMDSGVRNVLRWLNQPPHQVWAMATKNPARVVGLANKGSIRPGADADLVLWNDDLTANRTWVGGKQVFAAQT